MIYGITDFILVYQIGLNNDALLSYYVLHSKFSIKINFLLLHVYVFWKFKAIVNNVSSNEWINGISFVHCDLLTLSLTNFTNNYIQHSLANRFTIWRLVKENGIHVKRKFEKIGRQKISILGSVVCLHDKDKMNSLHAFSWRYFNCFCV